VSAPHFHEAGRGDVPAILALLADDDLGHGRENVSLEIYLAAFDRMKAQPGNLIIVGEKEGDIVACYQITLIDGLSRGGARRAQIEAVRDAANWRGAGIGQSLMQDAEARARAGGCALIQLTSDRARNAAHGFYEGLGYSPSHLGFKKSL